MSLTVLETAVVADSVADFSLSFKSFAAFETVSAMDAGDNGAGGKASAMVSGAVATDSVSGAGADADIDADSDSGAVASASIEDGNCWSNDSGISSGSS